MAQSTVANQTAIQRVYILKRWLEQVRAQVQFLQFCSPPDNVPLHEGDQARWMESTEWTVDTSTLSETSLNDNEVNSSGIFLGYTEPLVAKGSHIKTSTLVLDFGPASSFDKLADGAAQNASKTLDQLARDQAYLTGNIMYAGQTAVATSGQAASLRYTDFSPIQAYLETQGSDQGFSHLGGRFGAVIHPVAANQLRREATLTSGLPTLSETNKYVQGQQGQLQMGEVGVISNFKVFSSNQISASGPGGPNGFYKNVCLSKDGIGASALEGQTKGKPAAPGAAGASIAIKRPGPQSTNDIHDMVALIGWKWVGCFRLLNSARVVMLFSQQ